MAALHGYQVTAVEAAPPWVATGSSEDATPSVATTTIDISRLLRADLVAGGEEPVLCLRSLQQAYGEIYQKGYRAAGMISADRGDFRARIWLALVVWW